jgi:hypothetical protein
VRKGTGTATLQKEEFIAGCSVSAAAIDADAPGRAKIIFRSIHFSGKRTNFRRSLV